MSNKEKNYLDEQHTHLLQCLEKATVCHLFKKFLISVLLMSLQCRSRVKIIGGAHHERQSHEVLGNPGQCSSGKFLYRGSLK